MARRPAKKSIESRLVGVERGIKSLHASDMQIVKELREGFAHMENRFDQIYNHADGFVNIRRCCLARQNSPFSRSIPE